MVSSNNSNYSHLKQTFNHHHGDQQVTLSAQLGTIRKGEACPHYNN